jgi:hypothetical protein
LDGWSGGVRDVLGGHCRGWLLIVSFDGGNKCCEFGIKGDSRVLGVVGWCQAYWAQWSCGGPERWSVARRVENF